MSDPNQTVDEPGRESGSPAPAASSPTHIGRYRFEKVLGQGGFGLVYLAHDDQLHRLDEYHSGSKGTSMTTILNRLGGLVVLLGVLCIGSAQAQFRAGAAGYNPFTGNGGRAGVGYNPYTGNVAGGRTAYNPYTGGFAQRRTVYNPYTGGGASVRRGYNPYTGTAGVSVRRWR